ncbi:hypothetical protein Q8A67_000080 [Cirrhinus molitorella]|uniref:C-type lectin domain-containing protein n=1 Tax=Cirrhinus molitorella TaxID=172907 RepID=A0AA88Q7G1_9TELE|nr:hypothetical protein Q8A67_000080 [Cirrhinus molitorella]
MTSQATPPAGQDTTALQPTPQIAPAQAPEMSINQPAEICACPSQAVQPQPQVSPRPVRILLVEKLVFYAQLKKDFLCCGEVWCLIWRLWRKFEVSISVFIFLGLPFAGNFEIKSPKSWMPWRKEMFHFQAASKQGYMWGPDGLFISDEKMSWSESRQYCRNHGADLVIISSEEKQRHISSVIKERLWIGLSDNEQEGNMKWVDNSPLKQGFWVEGEPNNYHGKSEDCVEIRPSYPVLSSWNDLTCSDKIKGICEK